MSASRRTTLALVLCGVAAGWIAAAAQSPPPLTNRLGESASPYLRSAAGQPVHWQEWGSEAFALARRLDRPVYLHIGATWCHGCHEMDRESYDNAEIAALINRLFVPVKVDRDVRPDIDRRYQAAVAELAGASGWPLTAFLTPDGDVYFGASYLSPDTLKAVLPQVAKGYYEDRARVAFTARSLRRSVAAASAAGRAALSADLLSSIVDDIGGKFDSSDGGFGRAPKFPTANALTLLIHRYVQTGDRRLLGMVTRTLDKMATGGIRDQLSGRFHTYTVDRAWRVPHFEVMLHVQAELLSVYLDAYALTGNDLYRAVAEGLIGFLKTFASADGGFYASQDATPDQGGNVTPDEGAYFTWSVAQLEAAVSAEEAEVLRRYYDIRPRGEMAEAPRAPNPAQNVLWVAATPERIARDLRQPVDEVRRLIESGRQKMVDARRARPEPTIDRTILTDWSALTVSALLKAYDTFGDEEARTLALSTLDVLVMRSHSPGAGVFHARSGNERLVPGLLDDQVLLARALLDAYAATGDPAQLARARQIMVWTIEHLWDASGGGFFDRRPEPGAAGLLAVPRKEAFDSPAASGNAVAAQVLNRLYYLTQESRFRDVARVTLETFAGRARGEGPLMASLGIAADAYLDYPTTAVIVGRAGDPVAAALHRTALRTFRPGKIVLRVEPDRVERRRLPASVGPVLDGISADRWPLALVCSATVCALPTAAPARLAELVRTFGLTSGASSRP